MANIDYKNRSVQIATGITPDGQETVSVYFDRYDATAYIIDLNGDLKTLAGDPYTPSSLPNDNQITGLTFSGSNLGISFLNDVLTSSVVVGNFSFDNGGTVLTVDRTTSKLVTVGTSGLVNGTTYTITCVTENLIGDITTLTGVVEYIVQEYFGYPLPSLQTVASDWFYEDSEIFSLIEADNFFQAADANGYGFTTGTTITHIGVNMITSPTMQLTAVLSNRTELASGSYATYRTETGALGTSKTPSLSKVVTTGTGDVTFWMYELDTPLEYTAGSTMLIRMKFSVTPHDGTATSAKSRIRRQAGPAVLEIYETAPDTFVDSNNANNTEWSWFYMKIQP